jgi:L-glyceraldehyde 3-phosphate reductase
LLQTLVEEGIGCIAFSPLAQGLLSDRYLDGGVPADSRASRGVFLKPQDITAERLALLRALDGLARERGQTLAQMALTWVLRHEGMTSVLIGASREGQIVDAVAAANAAALSDGELQGIERVLASGG